MASILLLHLIGEKKVQSIKGKIGMSFCIESKYASSTDGPCREVCMANTTEELLTKLREAMNRPGWSDSFLINIESLPGPAGESWRQRAASKIQ